MLKPGEIFLLKTPNNCHYMHTTARVTPHVFHQFVNRFRGRAEVDTFPIHYRANTKGDIEPLASATGFIVDSLECIEGRPEYLRMTWPTYLLGRVYERIINSPHALAPFRILLVGVLRKK